MIWGDQMGVPGFYNGWTMIFGRGQMDPEEFTIRLLDWLRNHMQVDTATLLLPDAEAQKLAVKATVGLEEEIHQQIRIPFGQGIAGQIISDVKPIIVTDLSTVEIFSPILRDKGLRSLVGIPLVVNQTAIGVLHVGTHQPRQFNERDIQQLQLVAHRLQTAVLNRSELCFKPNSLPQATFRICDQAIWLLTATRNIHLWWYCLKLYCLKLYCLKHRTIRSVRVGLV